MLSQELIQSIQSDYDFVGSSYDRQGNFTGHHYLYSKVVQLFPTQVEEVKRLFPNAVEIKSIILQQKPMKRLLNTL